MVSIMCFVILPGKHDVQAEEFALIPESDNQTGKQQEKDADYLGSLTSQKLTELHFTDKNGPEFDVLLVDNPQAIISQDIL